ncbi:hypothetical protein UC34_10085 [Pandoraea vervacti]|uniref:phosphoribosylglycinamide formyltransferase 1 n=1 Tax=Pandoraea vervacti TaxID=656178 RepID=A0ABM6FQX7_9BURK|nr:formyltransferase family protein [Pandoraea vervacti]APD11218.1 hypothetical protein UC34_10085 [Pandoraea vervacti]
MTRKIAFLCSGGGGNLRFVAQAITVGLLGDARLCIVLTDRECLANQFARDQGISTQVMDFSRAEQINVSAALADAGADIVVTNVHRILGPALVEAFAGKLVNLHYSLLPAYGGMIGTAPIKAALAEGAKFIGVTAHDVTIEVDAGRPIAQAVIPTDPEDTVDTVMDTVFRAGCLTLLSALATPTDMAGYSNCRLHDREVAFNPPLPFSTSAFDDDFWQTLARYPSHATISRPRS